MTLTKNRFWFNYFLILSVYFLILGSSIGLVNAQEESTNQEKIACMKTAVEKREVALLSGFQTFADAHIAARNARKDALSQAWTIEDKTERKAAIKKAWADFKISRKAARQTWNAAREAAWAQFQKDKVACGYKESSGDSTKSDAAL